jgi:hypothetical protein
MQPMTQPWLDKVLSGEMARSGIQDINDAFASRDPVALAGSFGPSPLGIRAFHASPYAFDKFSMENLRGGTGGLAQGHGLYFAEHEPVSLDYKKGFQDRGGGWDGPSPAGPLDAAQQAANEARLNYPGSLNLDAAGIAQNVTEGVRLGDDLAHYRRFVQQSDWDPAKKAMYLAAIDAAKPYSFKPGPAHMYEVDINADPARMLDWDKPASQWADVPLNAAQDLAAARGMKLGDVTGERFYNELAHAEINPWNMAKTRGESVFQQPQLSIDEGKALASDALRQAGLPGIRYLDQFSRRAGQGTSNFVVNDANLVTILRRYGLLPPLAAGGLLAAPGQGEAAQP